MKTGALLLFASVIFANGFEQGNTLGWTDATHKPVVRNAWVGAACPEHGWGTYGRYTDTTFTLYWTAPCLEDSPLVVVVSSVKDPELVKQFTISDPEHEIGKSSVLEIPFPLPWKVEFPQFKQTQILKEITKNAN